MRCCTPRINLSQHHQHQQQNALYLLCSFLSDLLDFDDLELMADLALNYMKQYLFSAKAFKNNLLSATQNMFLRYVFQGDIYILCGHALGTKLTFFAQVLISLADKQLHICM